MIKVDFNILLLLTDFSKKKINRDTGYLNSTKFDLIEMSRLLQQQENTHSFQVQMEYV